MSAGRPALSIRTRLTLWYSGLLLVILVAIGALSYSWLRRTAHQDLDASLLAVAQAIQDTGAPGQTEGEVEALLRNLLGPELYDKLFRLLDPEGRPHGPTGPRRGDALPLSATARARAVRGESTLETVAGPGAEPLRVFTMPIVRSGRVADIVQVGMSLRRVEGLLDRYLHTLLVLIPLGVGSPPWAGPSSPAPRSVRWTR